MSVVNVCSCSRPLICDEPCLCREISRLRARVAELEEALRPFADLGQIPRDGMQYVSQKRVDADRITAARMVRTAWHNAGGGR